MVDYLSSGGPPAWYKAKQKEKARRAREEARRRRRRVVVVGAGPAGLTAALHLKASRGAGWVLCMAGALQCQRASAAPRKHCPVQLPGCCSLLRKLPLTHFMCPAHPILKPQRNGADVVVLEARNRVGGRVHSFQEAGFTAPVDLGGLATGLGSGGQSGRRMQASSAACIDPPLLIGLLTRPRLVPTLSAQLLMLMVMQAPASSLA